MTAIQILVIQILVIGLIIIVSSFIAWCKVLADVGLPNFIVLSETKSHSSCGDVVRIIQGRPDSVNLVNPIPKVMSLLLI